MILGNHKLNPFLYSLQYVCGRMLTFHLNKFKLNKDLELLLANPSHLLIFVNQMDNLLFFTMGIIFTSLY